MRKLELSALVLMFCLLQFGSFMSISETDLMKQAFSALIAFITGREIGRRESKP